MKKLLVWDGDNTLWDGVLVENCGETKIMSAKITDLVVDLLHRGVLQSVASHNLLKDVLKVLRINAVEDCFLMCKAEFDKPKSVMVKEIVAELGLSRFDDAVFVDDEMFNRADVETNCPGVIVVRPDQIFDAANHYFTKSSYTDEDRTRVERYRQEQFRRTASVAFGDDYKAFLRSCKFRLVMEPLRTAHLVRAADLVNRSNQMSILNEYVNPLSSYMLGVGSAWVGRVSDIYGDYGLSVVLLEAANNCRLDGLVISCRLQGKGIGSAVLGWWLNRHVGKNVYVTWKETPYNQQMKGLFEWYDFRVEGGVMIKSVNSLVELPDWIEVFSDEC